MFFCAGFSTGFCWLLAGGCGLLLAFSVLQPSYFLGTVMLYLSSACKLCGFGSL